MDDYEIVQMYLNRDERALAKTKEKYGGLCYNIAYNILYNAEDSEECVNDTYLGAWNSIPPNEPKYLSAYLAKITRRLSISKLRKMSSQKRDKAKEYPLDELELIISDKSEVFDKVEEKELKTIIQVFLKEQPLNQRSIFICRYFYCDSIEQISNSFGFTQSKVKTTLFRLRKKLKERLIKEGLFDE